MNIQISDHFNYRKLIQFTVPTIAMMIFTSIYGVVDGIFVSNCVGSDAFAAVNLIMPALMILDFLFVYLLDLGVAGAGLATIMSQLVGSVIPLVYFLKKNPSPLHLIKFEFDGNALLKSCTNGSSEMLTNLSMSLVSMLYNFQLMKFAGADGVAAYGIIMYVSFIFAGTYIGYSIGAAPIVSFHYGAGNHVELKNLFKKSLTLMVVISVILTVVAELTSGMLAGVFVSYDAELLAMTTLAIRLYSISYLFNGVNVFASAFFTALNDGLVSASISFLRTLLFQVVMIFLLPALFGLEGIWLAIVVAELLALIVSGICFVKFRKNIIMLSIWRLLYRMVCKAVSFCFLMHKSVL